MSDFSIRTPDNKDSRPIAAIPSRAVSSDMAATSIENLKQRTAYSPDMKEEETPMPDVLPDHKKHKSPKTFPAAIEQDAEVTAEEPPLAGAASSGKIAPPNSPIESLKVEELFSDHSGGGGQKTKKINQSDIAEVLLAEYDFAIFRDQLYLYSSGEGYWIMLPGSEANRKLRSIIPEYLTDSINKSVLSEVYEWLRVRARTVDSKFGEHRYFLNFVDCAVDWRTGDVIRDRKKLFFRYALQVR